MEGNPGEGKQIVVEEDTQRQGSLEPGVDRRRAVDMAVVHIQLMEELVDQSGTSAAWEELPSVEDQTCRLVCPFRPYVASAYKHKPSNRPSRTNKTVAETPLEFLNFQQSLQL